jgi:DNA helicase-2/ATP-dependent DNA helicase PcrA
VVQEELTLLDTVNERLATTIAGPPPSERTVAAGLAHIREALRDGAKAEDEAALFEQWDQQSALLRHIRDAERPAPIDEGTPYFAHLRLREDGRERDVLLGQTTRILEGVPIVDWRNAPISRVFYRYRQGDEFEEEIAGRLRNGEVVARRTVTVRDRALLRVEAPEGLFRRDDACATGWRRDEPVTTALAGGAGAALRAHEPDEVVTATLGGDALEQRPDRHLPDIASLLDPAQFDLVTRPGGGFIVVRGVAGSGKTTVALHRIAYLAYDDPTIDSHRTMFVVFSPALRRYVSHVLPALRVANVRVCTFAEWAELQVRRLFPRLPRRRREDVPALVYRLKVHPVLADALERQVARVPAPSTPEQVIADWMTVLTEPALLAESAAAVAPGAFSDAELARACASSRAGVEDLRAWLQGDGRVRDEVDAELDAEDLPLLLRAWQLRIGPLRRGDGQPLTYRHIAVDEVQDFSPVEVQVLLGCLDERRSITLAGDTQQHVVEGGGFTSWSDFLDRLGVPGAEVETLRVSYRCSQEIAEAAMTVLGDLREDDSLPATVRSGPPVELFRFTDHGAAVAFLAEALTALLGREPLATVAVLTPSPALSELYWAGLRTAEVPRLRRVAEQEFGFAPGVEVTEVEQAKGLEFDYVVCVEASTTSYPDTPSARRRLHVGMTRAIHQLWLTSVGSPSALLDLPER